MSYFEGTASGAEIRKGLETLAKATKEAAEIKAKAIADDSILDGKTAHADRTARARTDGLRLAVDLFAQDVENTQTTDDVIALADQFANFILHGTQNSASAFPGKQT